MKKRAVSPDTKDDQAMTLYSGRSMRRSRVWAAKVMKMAIMGAMNQGWPERSMNTMPTTMQSAALAKKLPAFPPYIWP